MAPKTLFKLIRGHFIRNIWCAALSWCLMFFMFPVSSFMSAAGRLNNAELLSPSDLALAKQYLYNDFLRQQDGTGILLVLTFLAVIMAFSSFAYLYDPEKTDFWHSLPVKRSALFSAGSITGILNTLVPYLFMALLSAAIIYAHTGISGCVSCVLLFFIINAGFFLLFYMTAVLAVMLTGTRITGLMLCFILYFWGIYISGLTDALMTRYFSTYYSIYGRTELSAQLLSPIGLGFISGGLEPEKRSAAAYIISILLLIFNIILYRLRRSEAASNAVAFSFIRTPLKILVVISAALGAMLFFGTMADDSVFWTLFAVICGTLISHAVMEIIYHMDFNSLFSEKPVLAGCIFISLLLFAFFKLDISGYDSYMPEESDISSVGLYSSSLEDIYGTEDTLVINELYGSPVISYTYYTDKDAVDRMELTAAIDDAAAIAAEGIEASENPESLYSPGSDICDVLIGWHLKNGRTVYRHYYPDTAGLYDEFRNIHDSTEFKKAIYPLLNKSADGGSSIHSIAYQDVLGIRSLSLEDLSDDERASFISRLYNVYCTELLKLTYDERHYESPVICLQFRSAAFDEIYEALKEKDDYSRMQLDYLGYYPVYPSFLGTISLLEKYGADINMGLNAENIAEIIITDYRDDYGCGTADTYTDIVYDGSDDITEAGDTGSKSVTRELLITDKQEISEVLDACSCYLACGNSLSQGYYGFDVSVRLEPDFIYMAYENGIEDMSGTIYLCFREGNIPAFVSDYFGM